MESERYAFFKGTLSSQQTVKGIGTGTDYCCSLLGKGMLAHELDGVSDSVNLLGNVVSNLQSELVLDSHDQLDHIQRIELQIVLEVRGGSDLHRHEKNANQCASLTLFASTASKFFTTSIIRFVTSSTGRNVYSESKRSQNQLGST